MMPWNLPCPPFREATAEAARSRQAHLTKPPGSLGLLEDIATQMAGFQDLERPAARPCSALLFAADHPVTRHGVSPYPSEVTAAMIRNFAQGGAAASVLARLHQIPLHVFDVGVEGASSQGEASTSEGVRVHRATPVEPAGDIFAEPALSEAGFERCAAYGSQVVFEHCRTDRVVILGEMGIGNTTCAAAVGAKLLGMNAPQLLVGAGTGATGAVLEAKKKVVAAAVARVSDKAPPREVLRQLGGREMVALYGAMRAALSQRKIVLVDGFIVTAVAMVLLREDAKFGKGMIFAHQSDERGHALLLEEAKARPLLRLNLRLGEASGALTAFPLLEAACATHESMATFESAAVPNKDAH